MTNLYSDEHVIETPKPLEDFWLTHDPLTGEAFPPRETREERDAYPVAA